MEETAKGIINTFKDRAGDPFIRSILFVLVVGYWEITITILDVTSNFEKKVSFLREYEFKKEWALALVGFWILYQIYFHFFRKKINEVWFKSENRVLTEKNAIFETDFKKLKQEKKELDRINDKLLEKQRLVGEEIEKQKNIILEIHRNVSASFLTLKDTSKRFEIDTTAILKNNFKALRKWEEDTLGYNLLSEKEEETTRRHTNSILSNANNNPNYLDGAKAMSLYRFETLELMHTVREVANKLKDEISAAQDNLKEKLNKNDFE